MEMVIKEQLRQKDFQQSRPSLYLLINLYLFIIIHLFIHSFIPIFKVPLETRWLGMTVSLSQPRIEIMATATRTIALFSTTEHGGTSIPLCDQTSMDGTIHKKPQRQMPLSGRSGEAQTQLWKEQKWKLDHIFNCPPPPPKSK